MASKRIPQQQQQQQQQQQRERGTPKNVSLLRAKHALLLVILVGILSSVLATLLFVHCASSSSSSHTSTTTSISSRSNNNDLLKLSFISSLGSLSTLVGIIFGDSLTHALAFGVAVRGRSILHVHYIQLKHPLFGKYFIIFTIPLSLFYTDFICQLLCWYRCSICCTRGITTVTTGCSHFNAWTKSNTIILGHHLK
jgi:hypothetical protein